MTFHPPDLDVARAFLEDHPPPGTVICAAITGAHQYGFPSPDSDLDIKAIHLAPTRAFLGLHRPTDTHEHLAVFRDIECDLTSNEGAKALGLLQKGNGNMLERIFSPFQLVESAQLDGLRALAEDLLSTRFANHYRGFFRAICAEHDRVGQRRAKTLLYAYRVALTGVHLLKTGALLADLRELAPRYGFDEALDLIEHKATTEEKASVSAAQERRHKARWPNLEALLDEALAESPLPSAPPDPLAADQWLVNQRLEAL